MLPFHYDAQHIVSQEVSIKKVPENFILVAANTIGPYQ